VAVDKVFDEVRFGFAGEFDERGEKFVNCVVAENFRIG
jgi:hypothetical protein